MEDCSRFFRARWETAVGCFVQDGRLSDEGSCCKDEPARAAHLV